MFQEGVKVTKNKSFTKCETFKFEFEETMFECLVLSILARPIHLFCIVLK